jgi:ketopantoate reductase
MKVLMVGAGAVGQVFGWHLQAGGAEVGFHVKREHAERIRAPLLLYPGNGRPRGRALSLTPLGLTTTPEEVADFAPD